MSNWISAFEPDVVHVHTSRLPVEVKDALGPYPLVHSLHDFSFACASGAKYFRDGRPCRRAHGPGCLVAVWAQGCAHRLDPRPFLARYRSIELELPTLHQAGALVTHSDFMRSVALANGLPPERVLVVPFSIVREDRPPAPVPERTIAFAGRIVREKGLDLLLKGLAHRPVAWDRLLVAGDGYDRERCRRLADRRGIGAKVEFLGHLDETGVRETIRRSRVVVVPSRWPEPFGLVGLEAMACARSVVASDTGGIPEWLEDGRTGVLVPAGDAPALAAALVSLLDDPDRAAAMGLEGWRRVERFSPERHLRKLVAAYELAGGTSLEAAAEAMA